MTQTCSAHPEAPAVYQCDGCQKMLCDECITPSRALLLCEHCGERALPLGGEAPATVKEHSARSAVAAGADYQFVSALTYPFRGTGLFMFLSGLLAMFCVGFIRRIGFGCLPVLIWLGWLSLLAGIQFKIVKTTAQGDNELPDWPEYFSFGERFVEFMTWMVVGLLHYGPVAIFILAFGGWGALSEPSFFFWIGAAAFLWLGSALAIMGFGAAGVHWRHQSLRIDLHLRGLLTIGADALLVTNFTFILFAVVFVTRILLGATVPLVGTMVASVLGLYWAFVEPHLAGVLFRRHARKLHDLYEG